VAREPSSGGGIPVHLGRELSPARKNALLVGFRVAPEEPIKLSARNSVHVGSRVDFHSPHHVSGAPDTVLFGAYDTIEERTFMRPPHEGAHTSVVFRFANRSAHLIDVCVFAMPNGPQATFTLTGAVNETRTLDAGEQHLTSLLPANSGGRAEVNVSCSDAWRFYFAELTPVTSR